MIYDFDTPLDRTGTDSYKWDIRPGELPMWVADMDFETAPCVKEAVLRRAQNGAYGYTVVPDTWTEAYQNWWQRRHGLTIEKDWLIFATGVVPAISSIVRKLTTPNENVLLMTPVYNIFFNSTVNNGCRVLESPLKYENGVYSIDWADLEKGLSDPQTSLLILCNPHNPVGRIWTKEELAGIGDLCKKYHVTVVSDEIHCELTEPGLEYTPFAAVNDTCREISVTCVSPSKAFNIAGLQSAAVFAADEALRHKVWRGLNTDECAEPNIFACAAVTAALTEGEEWLEQLKDYLWKNREYAADYISRNIPGTYCVPAEATYLLWLDCTRITKETEKLAAFIREKTGLIITEGDEYGKAGQGFLRINLACARSVVEEGMRRLAEGFRLFREQA